MEPPALPSQTGSPPTLAEVAALAGVSSITVSRVVRMPDIVATATRERVEAAMRTLGYVPNLVAGSLASARTRLVGVLVPTIATEIFADTVKGLSDVMEPLGYAVILAQSRYDEAREEKMLSALLARRPDALVMVGSPATAEGRRLLERAGIPVVETWDLPERPVDAAAGFDNLAAGMAVGRHFAAAGRRRMAFIGGSDPRATRRFLGFEAAVAEAGLAAPQRLVLERNATAGAAALAQLPAGVDAVFAANDAHALGLLMGMGAASGGGAPQVAVVGLGDLEMGRLIRPRLSTIMVHGEAIGRAAAALVLDRAGPRRVDLGFELVVRESG